MKVLQIAYLSGCIALAGILTLNPAAPVHAFGGEDWVLVEHFKKTLASAEAGDAMAMYKAGQLYERGRGTAKDLTQAIGWYDRAMRSGNQFARGRLGIMYYEGIGYPRDLKKASQLLHEAAKADVPNAQLYLGIMYENGAGVAPSSEKAKHWYKLAIKNGSYQAKNRLRALEKGYTSAGKKSGKPVNKVTRKVDLAAGLRDALLEGNWQRNKLAVGFLPSDITTCKKIKNSIIRCRSKQQQRNTGDRVISYFTESTLSGFNNKDEFRVKYQNTILTSSKAGNAIVAEDDEGDYAVAAGNTAPGAGLGKQKTVHKLECEMEAADKLVCLKNRTRRLTYKNVR